MKLNINSRGNFWSKNNQTTEYLYCSKKQAKISCIYSKSNLLDLNKSQELLKLLNTINASFLLKNLSIS